MAPISLLRLGVLLLLPAFLVSATFEAEAQPAEKPLEVVDCLQQMGGDSTHVFFDSNFALTPPSCAYFRRECRMDVATGVFTGPARDYRQFSNKLVRKMRYANGRRNGRYEEFYANQQLAIRGQFTDGYPSGTWQFWYEDGRPRQTLQWTGYAHPSVRVVSFWDADGQQRVTNGEGVWQGQAGGMFPTRFGGPVVKGFQQGEWESRDARTNEVRTIEEFDQGRLKQGQQVVAASLGAVGQQQAAQLMKYTERPSLEIQVNDASQSAEPLRLGQNCAQQERAREATKAVVAAMLDGKDAKAIQMPLPKPTPGMYQRSFLKRLSQNQALAAWLPQQEGSKSTIKADVDEHGQLLNVVAASKELAAAATQAFHEMGAWKPAVVNGKTMPGRVEIELRWEHGELQSVLKTNLAGVVVPGTWFDSKF